MRSSERQSAPPTSNIFESQHIPTSNDTKCLSVYCTYNIGQILILGSNAFSFKGVVYVLITQLCCINLSWVLNSKYVLNGSNVLLRMDGKYRSRLHTVRTPASYCVDVHPLSIRDKLWGKAHVLGNKGLFDDAVTGARSGLALETQGADVWSWQKHLLSRTLQWLLCWKFQLSSLIPGPTESCSHCLDNIEAFQRGDRRTLVKLTLVLLSKCCFSQQKCFKLCSLVHCGGKVPEWEC